MTEYIEVEQARDLPGPRLVLTAGVPGPWGEAAKGLFDVKGIPYVRVRMFGLVHELAGENGIGWPRRPMLDPLPEYVCAMGRMRQQYTLSPDAGISVDPALLEHRDLVYREHLTPPLDF